MEYKGKLFGKINGKAFSLEKTTEDFERLEKLEQDLKDHIEKQINNCEIMKSDSDDDVVMYYDGKIVAYSEILKLTK